MGIAPSELEQIAPPHFEVPHRLKRRSIKETQRENGGVFLHDLWNERGEVIEVRTQRIIASQTDIAKEVILKEKFAKGSDLIVKFVDGFPVKEAEIEVKSSSLELKHGKQKIRNRMLNEELNKEIDGQINGLWVKKAAVDGWNRLPDDEKELRISSHLTENNRMLINSGEQDKKEKTPDQILWESFNPQLERLVWKANGMTPEETVIAQREGQIQIWPWVRPSSFTELAVEKKHSNPILDKLKKYLTSSFWIRTKYPSPLPIQLFR